MASGRSAVMAIRNERRAMERKMAEQVSEINRWDGVDFWGPNGNARWTAEECHRTVYYFNTRMSLVWQVTLDPGAPDAIFKAALAAAKVAAGYLK